MRIAVAQMAPKAGDIAGNLVKHFALIELAASCGARAICFPELSLTGYEPKLAKALATTVDDERLDQLEILADARRLSIYVGLPTVAPEGIRITLIAFQPGLARVAYSKQHLHADELPYFVRGDAQAVFEADGRLLAPAICYDSLQQSHAARAAELRANVYLASVAKSKRGVDKAFAHYPEVARRYGMLVAMANCVGPCDDFVAGGQSAVWGRQGELLAQLDDHDEGVVWLDTSTYGAGCCQL